MRARPFLIAAALLAATLIAGCQNDSKSDTPKTPEVGTRTKKAVPTLSLASIKATKDDQLENLLFDYCMARFGKFENQRAVFDSLPKGLQIFWSTWDLEGEVYNGGFHQYFFNSDGEFADDALKGLKLIGATPHAKLLEEAIAIYAKEKSAMDSAKEKGTLDAFSESAQEAKFDKLDKKFYDLGDSLFKARIKYIRAHPEEFLP